MTAAREGSAGRAGTIAGRRVGLVAALIAAATIACTPAQPTGEPTIVGDPTAPPVPPSPVVGVIVDVTSTGLGEVERFTLRLADGTSIVLHMGALDNAVEFPPGHLAEHQATSEPIRVYFRDAEVGPTVYRLEDAAEPPGT